MVFWTQHSGGGLFGKRTRSFFFLMVLGMEDRLMSTDAIDDQRKLKTKK